MDTQFKTALSQVCTGDNAVALITVIRVKGSTPRKPGAKMIIMPDGQIFGTIGGGCGEAEVKREALDALATLTPTKYTVNMTNDMALEEGMVCGGIMEVFIDILGPGADEGKTLINDYLAAINNNELPVLLTITGSANPAAVSQRLYVTSSGHVFGVPVSGQLSGQTRQLVEKVRSERKAYLLEEPDLELFVEPPPSLVKLIILGGGHIAKPLALMGKMLDYHVTVVDDRPAFANSSRFPTADCIICGDFTQSLQSMDITPETFIVIVTRGHRHDKLCLLQVITKPAAYIGMIGSRRRVKTLMTDLRESGIPEKYLQKINSPIGLDIRAETPEEIAVSILSEIISVYRGGSAQSLKPDR